MSMPPAAPHEPMLTSDAKTQFGIAAHIDAAADRYPLLLRHVVPFLFALVLVVPVGLLVCRGIIFVESKLGWDNVWFSNMYSAPNVPNRIRSNLRHGGVLVLASSELAVKSEYRTCHFLTQEGYPCVALGHAGNQHLAMSIVLAGNADLLANAKIAIFIGPGWFTTQYSAGTSLPSFLEFSDEQTLFRAWSNPTTPASLKSRIADFVDHNYDHINKPQTAVRLVHRQSNVASRNLSEQHETINYFSNAIDNISIAYIDARRDPMTTLIPAPQAQRPRMSLVVTDDVATRLQQKFINTCHNDYAVADEYFDKYLKHRRLPLHTSFSPTSSREFRDFLILLDVLERIDAKPFFVIEPLNPYVYSDLDGFADINRTLQAELQRRSFPYLDMFVSETRQYRPGTLYDSMHIGDVGWIEINNALVKNWNLP